MQIWRTHDTKTLAVLLVHASRAYAEGRRPPAAAANDDRPVCTGQDAQKLS